MASVGCCAGWRRSRRYTSSVQLCRYITRPALSDERVQLNAAGQVVVKLKTPWRDGTTHLVMSPLEFVQRQAALIQQAATALANDRFTAVDLGSRMPGLGRQRLFATFRCSRSDGSCLGQ